MWIYYLHMDLSSLFVVYCSLATSLLWQTHCPCFQNPKIQSILSLLSFLHLFLTFCSQNQEYASLLPVKIVFGCFPGNYRISGLSHEARAKSQHLNQLSLVPTHVSVFLASCSIIIVWSINPLFWSLDSFFNGLFIPLFSVFFKVSNLYLQVRMLLSYGGLSFFRLTDIRVLRLLTFMRCFWWPFRGVWSASWRPSRFPSVSLALGIFCGVKSHPLHFLGCFS